MASGVLTAGEKATISTAGTDIFTTYTTGPEYFSYPRGTHVCVLVGYDDKNVYLADPYGAKTKTFSRSAFNDKYKLLGRQAVVVQ